MITTWQLWRALKHPPTDHPVFRRMTTETYRDSLIVAVQNMFLQGQIWLWPLVFMLDMRALVLMVFSGTIYGVVWAMRISSAIGLEQERHTYELLCLSPSGKTGTAWAICTGCLHRGQAFFQINSQESWSVRLVLFIPIILSAPFILRHIFDTNLNITFVGLIAAIMIFCLDHVQSILFGSLFGMLASFYASTRHEQRLWALGSFMLVQIVSYLVLVITSLWVLPNVFRTTPFADIALPVVSILIFYSLREYILKRLYRVLKEQWGSAPAELNFLAPDRTAERTTSGYADAQVVARTP